MAMNIIVGAFAVVVIVAGFFAWWMENGPESKTGHKEDDSTEELISRSKKE